MKLFETMVRPLAGAGIAALLLAGCASNDADAENSSDAPSTSTSPQAGGPGGEAGPGGFMDVGVTGAIAYVADGTAQVQDDFGQTAVRFTDETEVSKRVDIAASDIKAGQCVSAVVDDDGPATSVSVSDPEDDGTCAPDMGAMGGLGGGWSMMGGDGGTPSDMPTTMPTRAPEMDKGIEDLEDSEGGRPSAEAPGGDGPPEGLGGVIVTGLVKEASADKLTVTTEDGDVTDVTLGSDTEFTGTQAADASAIETGMCMSAQGEADDAGGYDATNITVFDGGEEGCLPMGNVIELDGSELPEMTQDESGNVGDGAGAS